MPPTTRTTRVKRGSIYILQSIFDPGYKVELVKLDGTVVDVSGTCRRAEYTYEENRIGSCACYLNNDNGDWTDILEGGETLKIYADNSGGIGSTLRFEGKIDEIYYVLSNEEGYSLKLECRQTPSLADKTVLASFVDVPADEAVETLLNENFAGVVTFTRPATPLANITIDIRHESGIGAIGSILSKVDYVFHITAAGVLTIFEKGTRTNAEGFVSEGVNLDLIEGVGKNIKNVRNRVFVYGGNVDKSPDIFPLATSEDLESQARFGIKDQIINPTSVLTVAEAQGLAQSEQTQKVDYPTEGSVGVIGGMLTVMPGEKVGASAQRAGLKGEYEVTKITHYIYEGIRCVCYLSKPEPRTSEVFKGSYGEAYGKRSFQNPNGMKHSKIFKFEDGSDFATITGLSFSQSKASLTTGNNTGRAKTSTLTYPSFRYVEARAFGNDVGGTNLRVSRDEVTWFDVPYGSVIDLGDEETQIVIEFVWDNTAPYTNPQLDAAGVYFK